MKEMDDDGSGAVEWPEFMRAMARQLLVRRLPPTAAVAPPSTAPFPDFPFPYPFAPDLSLPDSRPPRLPPPLPSPPTRRPTRRPTRPTKVLSSEALLKPAEPTRHAALSRGRYATVTRPLRDRYTTAGLRGAGGARHGLVTLLGRGRE